MITLQPDRGRIRFLFVEKLIRFQALATGPLAPVATVTASSVTWRGPTFTTTQRTFWCHIPASEGIANNDKIIGFVKRLLAPAFLIDATTWVERFCIHFETDVVYSLCEGGLDVWMELEDGHPDFVHTLLTF